MDILTRIVNFFISPAHAETAAQPQAAGGFSLIFMLAIFVVFMYFMVWRPQSKRAKAQSDLLAALVKGDEVITIGGILGKISKISDNYVVLSVSDNVEVNIQKSAIANVLPKGTLKSI